jgi:hypothetical protein
MHMGDIAHNPVTSLAILDCVATDGVMAMGYHFPFPAIGHVVRHGAAYHWEASQWAW